MNKDFDLIWYANDLPHKATVIKQIRKQDVPKALGIDFLWSEQFHFPAGVSEEYKAKFHERMQDAIDEICDGPAIQLMIRAQSSMMLCNMGAFGHGVFARNKILKGTPLAIYIGRFTEKKNQIVDKEYLLEQGDGSQRAVDARSVRNFAGFFQHLPSKNNPLWVFNENPTGKVATSNLRRENVFVDDWEVALYLASDDIPPCHLIGFDYNAYTWVHRNKQPIAFTPLGEVCHQNIVTMLEVKYHPLIWALATKLYGHILYYKHVFSQQKLTGQEFLDYLDRINDYAIQAAICITPDFTEDQKSLLLSSELQSNPKKFRIAFSTFLHQNNSNLNLYLAFCSIFDSARESINLLINFTKEEFNTIQLDKIAPDIPLVIKNDLFISSGIVLLISLEHDITFQGKKFKSDSADKFWDRNSAFWQFAETCLDPEVLAVHIKNEKAFQAMPVYRSENDGVEDQAVWWPCSIL